MMVVSKEPESLLLRISVWMGAMAVSDKITDKVWHIDWECQAWDIVAMERQERRSKVVVGAVALCGEGKIELAQ